ncbi:MAG: dihydrolipoyl dehydrogenase [Candidatus Methanomethylicaceae archaeon]
MKKFDVVVIGAGPAGYVAAIRLSQLGKKVALIEGQEIGGTCLNRGCIPTKAIIHVGHLVKEVTHGERMGIRAESLSLDYRRMMSWIGQIVTRLRSGIDYLLRAYNVEIVRGEASFQSESSIAVSPQGDKVEGEYIVIATGSIPFELPFARSDSKRILTSDDIFKIDGLPGDLVILGGGVIGTEMATAFSSLGTRVTIIEIMDQILPGYAREVISPVEASLHRMGVQIRVSTKVERCIYTESGEKVRVYADDGTYVDGDYLLLSVGRRPNTRALKLESANVGVDSKGFIKVDGRMETTTKGIFAIGDVVGLPFLAHKAMEEGYHVAEIIAGLRDRMPKLVIPSVVYSDPEIATVGLDESDAIRAGIAPMTGKFPFASSGRSLTLGRSDGFVKVVGDSSDRKIIGAQIVGQGASELIGEISWAISSSLKMDNLVSGVHPHPTMSEAIIEAIRLALGSPLHYQK